MSKKILSYEELEKIHMKLHTTSKEYLITPSKGCPTCANKLEWFIMYRDLDLQSQFKGLRLKEKRPIANNAWQILRNNYSNYKNDFEVNEAFLSYEEWIFYVADATVGELFNLKIKSVKE